MWKVSDESMELATLQKDFLEKLSVNLTDREKRVLDFYFKKELTYARIGNIIGLSPERVRQIIWKAIRKIRKKAYILKVTPNRVFGIN